MILHIRWIVGRYKRLRIEHCTFYGPEDFLAVSQKAMNMLRTADAAIYESVIHDKYTFWYEPEAYVFFKKLCSISRSYLAWEEYGVITCVVHGYFVMETAYRPKLPRMEPKEFKRIDRDIYYGVYSWLEKHQFPIELVNCFKVA